MEVEVKLVEVHSSFLLLVNNLTSFGNLMQFVFKLFYEILKKLQITQKGKNKRIILSIIYSYDSHQFKTNERLA